MHYRSKTFSSGQRGPCKESVLSAGPDPAAVCHRTNVLMLFIGLDHLKSSRLVDGPLGLMGNSIILG